MRFPTLIAAVFVLVGCSEPPAAEADIKAALATMEEAVQNNNPEPVLERLHEDFELNRSGRTLSRAQAERLFKLMLRRHQNVSVVLTRIDVEPDSTRSDRARALFSAVITSSSRSRFLPEEGRLYRIESDWALDGGEWKLLDVVSRRTLNR